MFYYILKKKFKTSVYSASSVVNKFRKEQYLLR